MHRTTERRGFSLSTILIFFIILIFLTGIYFYRIHFSNEDTLANTTIIPPATTDSSTTLKQKCPDNTCPPQQPCPSCQCPPQQPCPSSNSDVSVLQDYTIISQSMFHQDDIEMEFRFAFEPYERPEPILFESPLTLDQMSPVRPHTWNGADTIVWSTTPGYTEDPIAKKNYYIHTSKFAFVAKVKQGHVCCDGMMFWEPIRKRIFCNFFVPQLPGRIPKFTANTPVAKYDKLATVAKRYGFGYWHFISEVLPQLLLLLPTLKRDPSIKILMSDFGSKIHLDYFAMLELDTNRVVRADFGTNHVYYANELYVPTPISEPTNAREMLFLVHDYFVPKDAVLTKQQRKKIIVVDRSDASERRINNHQSMMDALHKEFDHSEYEIVNFLGSQLKPKETITLFSQARIIIGPVGAGLSNAIFAEPGTAIISVHLRGTEPNMCHWHNSISMCQPYHVIVAEQNAPGQNLIVDPAKVVRLTKSILTSQNSNNNSSGCTSGCPARYCRGNE